MAAPLTKENREKIVDYLKSLDLSNLTGFQIKELIKKDLEISISQPTASKLKAEVLEDNSGYGELIEDSSSSEQPTLSEEIGTIEKPTKPDKIRQLTVEQQNAIDHLLQGKSDRLVAEAVGVTRQTVCDWRNKDILFIAELNRQRSEMWHDARERLRDLANSALDTLERMLANDDPKVALAAVRLVLQGTQLIEGNNLPPIGPTTPEGLLMPGLRKEAYEELEAKYKDEPLDFLRKELVSENDVITLTKKKLKTALEEQGLA